MASAGGQVRKLTDIETLGVALVTRGANRKRFALTKGDDEMTVSQLLAQIIQKGDMPMDDESINKLCQQAGLDAQGTETFKAVLKLSSAYKDSPAFAKMLKEQLPQMLGLKSDGEAEPDPQDPNEGKEPPAKEPAADKPAASEKPAAEEDKVNNAGPPGASEKEKAMSKADDKTNPGAGQTGAGANGGGTATTTEGVNKSADAQKVEALEALTKSQNDQLKEMRELLQKQADDTMLSKWVSKSERDLKFVPGKSPEELGKMFFDIEKKVSAEMAQSQFETYKATSAMLQKSAMFQPAGVVSKSAHGSGKDAWSKIVAKSDVVLEKSDILKNRGTSEMHRAQAVAKAMELDPSLYEDYLREHPAQSGDRFSH